MRYKITSTAFPNGMTLHAKDDDDAFQKSEKLAYKHGVKNNNVLIEQVPDESDLRAALIDRDNEIASLRDELEAAQAGCEIHLELMRKARIALTFYANWMVKQDEQARETYPYGKEIESELKKFETEK